MLLISLELVLRICFGFCDAVLIREDTNYEYIAKPNQHRFRFNNNIFYNSKSMRSEEIDPNAMIILGFGDSVINGGSQTDQDSLATTIISKVLSKIFNFKIQFLNISAGSWGPDNCYAYLEKHGDFSAKAIFLFVSSHDAYDNMNFEKLVNVNKSFPGSQYTFAIHELLDRYLFPNLKNNSNSNKVSVDLAINKKRKNSLFNTGFKSFLNYSKENNIPFVIYLHANKNELKSGDYNLQGKEIINFAESNEIPIILDLENKLDQSDFRDFIHLNLKGQRELSNTILNFIKEHTLLSKNQIIVNWK